MKNIKLDNVKKIYFIGIGGISMSGIAQILHKNNFIIAGSDNKKNYLTDKLANLNIKIFIGHKYENITKDIDLVVYTAAIKDNNEEILSAKDKNIKIIDRAELLSMILKNFKNSICISGTHGKTTTSSIISEILLNAKKDPTIFLGGILKSINGNFYIGNSDFLVLESCEYKNSFLKFYPYVGIILNIEEDHADYFKNLNEIKNSFKKFSQNINNSGYLIINKKIKFFDEIIKNLNCNIVSFGHNTADLYAENINFLENGKSIFNLYYKNKFLEKIYLNIQGYHNIENALAAIALCLIFKIDIKIIKSSLKNFNNPERRFQIKGEVNNLKIIDDYAHHPTEIKNTLLTAKKIKHNKIYCVFQPHTFSRTLKFLDEFASSFENADVVIILDIYPAREKDNKLIHSKDLVDKIKNLNKNVFYFSSFKKAEEYIIKNYKPFDLLLTIGAGDVYLLGENILKNNI